MKNIICLGFILATMLSKQSQASLLTIDSLEQSKKVSLLIASGQGFGQSTFGHAYLRFSSGHLSENDSVIEIVANIPEQNLTTLQTTIKGLGLSSERFKSKLVVIDYRSVKYEMNILQNRELTTYPLNLSSEQVRALIEFMKQKKDKIETKDYLFLSNNCASGVSELIDATINFNEKSVYSVAPTLLAKKYKSLIDSASIKIDKSAEEQRKYITKNYLPNIEDLQKNTYLKNIEEQLLSDFFYVRSYAFFKLLNLDKLGINISKQDRQKIKTFLVIYSQTEPLSRANEMTSLVLNKNNSTEIIFKPLFNTDKDYPLKQSAGFIAKSSFRSKVILNKDRRLTVRFFYLAKSTSDDQYSTEKSIDIPIESYGITLDGSNIVYSDSKYTNQIVGYIPKSSIYDFEIKLNHIQFQSEVISGSDWDYIIPTAILEFEKNSAANKKSNLNALNYSFFKGTDALLLTNYSNQGLANCASIIFLQKLLLEQVEFYPNAQKISADESLNLINDVINGNFIIVPGYKNIGEWILSVDQNKLKKIIDQLSYNINITGYGNLIKKYFSRVQINSKNISDLDISFSTNIAVPLRFKVDGIKSEHMILVSEFIDKGDHYELGVYDPNIPGFVPAGLPGIKEENRYKIDKKTGLFMQSSYTQGTPIFADIMSLERPIFFQQIKNNPEKIENLYQRARTYNKYSFSISELLSP